MKKVILLVLILITTIIPSHATDGDDYRGFYEFINKAELCIIEEKYNEAYEIYSEAFKTWNNAPAIDYYNALLCAVHIDNYTFAFDYIRKLILKGWELNFFTENPFLDKLRNEAKWDIIVSEYQLIYKEYKKSLDSVLIKEFDDMFEKDQSLVNSNNYSEYLRTVISNANRIHELIIENKTSNWNSTSVYSVFYSFCPSVLLRHYGGVYNEIKKGYIDTGLIFNDTIQLIDLEKALLGEIKKGHLSPLVYDFSTTYSGDINKFGNGLFFKVGDIILRKNFTENEEMQINENRKMIGQEPLSDYIKKMDFIYSFKDKNLKPYYFKFRVTEVIYQMTGDEEKLEKFINNRLEEGWEKITH